MMSASGTAAVPADADDIASPVWARPVGEATYVMTTDYLDAQYVLESRIVARFMLLTRTDHTETINVLEASVQSAGSDQLMPIELDRTCREAFGGTGGSIGRFEFSAGMDLNNLAPSCIPETLFGVVADFISFLAIQAEGFGISGLAQPGDRVDFQDDEYTWNRPPSTIEGRIFNTGGSLTYALKTGSTALLNWRPKPWDIGVIRSLEDGMAIFLGGTETFWLDAEVDVTTGVLLSGRTAFDKEDFHLWVPYTGTHVPIRADWPEGPGTPRLRYRRIVLQGVDSTNKGEAEPQH